MDDTMTADEIRRAASAMIEEHGAGAWAIAASTAAIFRRDGLGFLASIWAEIADSIERRRSQNCRQREAVRQCANKIPIYHANLSRQCR